jgi:RNA polymerase sigma factor (sigma-70 family)
MDETAADMSDQALVAECLSGNQEAWTQLLDRHKRLIYASTYRYGFDLQDRHDVFQAVCVEILKNLHSLRNVSSLRHWVLTITLRQCYALLKRRRSERGQEPDETLRGIEDHRPQTIQLYLAAERAEKLREAMEELPDRCRTLLELLFFSEDKATYSELGWRLGLSKDTIGSVRLRCLDKLRKILEDKGF